MIRPRRIASTLIALPLAAGLFACASTSVRLDDETAASDLPRPERILVYDFALSEAEIATNSGIGSQIVDEESTMTPEQRQEQLGRHAANALAESMVKGLRQLGFATERVPRGTPAVGHDLLVDGHFLDVNEGNRLRRVVIGFGAGAADVDTRVQLYQGARDRRLLEFSTHSDSGEMPGAAVTMGAGAAAQGGLTAGAAAVNVAASGWKVYRSQVEQMAARSGDKAVAYMSQFFFEQEWIRADQVRSMEPLP